MQKGFTLIELMMAILIGSILLGLAIPAYRDMIKNNCLTTASNTIIGSFQYARSEAAKFNGRTQVSSLNNGRIWQVRLSEDRNGNGTLDRHEDYSGNGVLDTNVLIRESSLACDVDINTVNPIVTFESSGFLMGSTSERISVCDDRTGETGRLIELNITGRPHIDRNFLCP